MHLTWLSKYRHEAAATPGPMAIGKLIIVLFALIITDFLRCYTHMGHDDDDAIKCQTGLCKPLISRWWQTCKMDFRREFTFSNACS